MINKLQFPEFWKNKGIISTILLPFSWVYIFLGYLRYKITKPVKFPSFVICVGNMTVGGTGKTQIVKWLAQKFKLNNYKFLIVTKGYASNLKGAKLVTESDLASEVGDESKLLSTYGNVLAAKSIKCAIPIIEELNPDIIIFDDGMQNPGFRKDLIILTIDPLRVIGNNRIFPSGPLREPYKVAIGKSDIIIWVGKKADHAERTIIHKHMKTPKPDSANIELPPVSFEAEIKLVNSIDTNKKYYAFSGIGNPEKFFSLLKLNGANLVLTKSFPDHHNYSQKEIFDLRAQAHSKNCQLITTRKDFVKIINTKNIECADIELIFNNEDEILNIINEKIKTHI